MAIRNRRSFKIGPPDFGAPFKIGNTSRLVRWCENPDAYMRRMGFAAEVYQQATGLHPRYMGGWYTDEDQSTLARGVVFRLSHGRGFVAGVADSDNDGAAMLAVCEAPEESPEAAARYADNLAEWYAEAERDYQAAWRAGQEAGEARAALLAQAADSLDKARAMRKGARAALVRALAARSGEALGFLPPGAADEGRRLYVECLTRARDHLAAACESRRAAWRDWRSARAEVGRDVRDSFDDGAACA